jgi:hypothetical protein
MARRRIPVLLWRVSFPCRIFFLWHALPYIPSAVHGRSQTATQAGGLQPLGQKLLVKEYRFCLLRRSCHGGRRFPCSPFASFSWQNSYSMYFRCGRVWRRNGKWQGGIVRMGQDSQGEIPARFFDNAEL